MHIRIDGHIRGESIRIVWRDGRVTGDLELVDRARRLHQVEHGTPIDETDAVAFITALSHASCQRLEVQVLDDRLADLSL